MTEEEIRNQYLQELDAFHDEWVETFRRNNIPIGQASGIGLGYFRGDIEEIPGPLTHPRFCPICKQRPADLLWADFEEDHYIENNQEYITQGGYCKCDSFWLVAYKLLPIKMEEQ